VSRCLKGWLRCAEQVLVCGLHEGLPAEYQPTEYQRPDAQKPITRLQIVWERRHTRTSLRDTRTIQGVAQLLVGILEVVVDDDEVKGAAVEGELDVFASASQAPVEL